MDYKKQGIKDLFSHIYKRYYELDITVLNKLNDLVVFRLFPSIIIPQHKGHTLVVFTHKSQCCVWPRRHNFGDIKILEILHLFPTSTH